MHPSSLFLLHLWYIFGLSFMEVEECRHIYLGTKISFRDCFSTKLSFFLSHTYTLALNVVTHSMSVFNSLGFFLPLNHPPSKTHSTCISTLLLNN